MALEKIGLKAELEMSGFQAGMRAYLSGTKQMESETEKLLHSLQPVGIALAAVGAAGTAFIRSATLTAARTEELSLVLDVLAENSRQTAIAEGDLARASQLTTQAIDGTVDAVKDRGITTQVATKLVSQFARYELDMVQASDLARVAQDAAVISMQDSSEALDGLLHGILTYNPVVLRTYGITVQAADAFEAFAASNGLVADELTNAQRSQAMLNAVLQEGTSISGAYEAAMNSVGKQLRSLMGRELEEFKNAMGDAYLPLMLEAVTSARDLLKAFNALDPAQQKMIANLLGIGTVVSTVGGTFLLLTPRIIATVKALGTLGGFASNVGFSLKLIGAGANVADLGLAGMTAKAIAAVGPLAALIAVVLAGNKILEGHHEKTIALSDSYERYMDMMRKTGRASAIVTEAEWEQQRSQAAQVETTETAAQATDAYTQRLMGLAMAYAEVARQLEPTEEQLKKLAELETQMAEDQADIARRVVAMERDYNQQIIDMNIDRARTIEDIDRDLAKSREQAATNLASRLAAIEAQGAQQQQQAAYDHAQRMADIEEQYQERIRDIQKRYRETMWDAISNRDATAALKAMRTRREELDEAKRDRDQQNTDASTDYARQQEEQARNLEIQRQQAQQAYQEQMADLQTSRAEQIEELDRSLARQLEDLERHNQWTLQEMRQEFRDEYAEMIASYASEEALYAQHLENMRRLWAAYGGTWGTPRSGSRGFIGGYAEGGSFVTGGPTTATFGEGGVPELVTAVPLRGLYRDGGASGGGASGTMRHEVSGAIDGVMGGFEGRLTGAITGAVLRAFGEVLH